jgi:hypothetical protein
MTSVMLDGPVIVMDDAEVLTTFSRLFAAAVASVAVQTKLDVEVNAGEIPVTVTVLGVPLTRGTLPYAIFAANWAVAAHAEVVPQY